MSAADDIKRLAYALASAEMWDGYAEQQAAEVALHTAIDALQSERDALLETQRKFGALMHKTMGERDSLLAVAHKFINTIECVENRCMAADGPVTRTCKEITDDELRAIYKAARAAIKASEGKAA
jgi:hypothetical protein